MFGNRVFCHALFWRRHVGRFARCNGGRCAFWCARRCALFCAYNGPLCRRLGRGLGHRDSRWRRHIRHCRGRLNRWRHLAPLPKHRHKACHQQSRKGRIPWAARAPQQRHGLPPPTHIDRRCGHGSMCLGEDRIAGLRRRTQRIVRRCLERLMQTRIAKISHCVTVMVQAPAHQGSCPCRFAVC